MNDPQNSSTPVADSVSPDLASLQAALVTQKDAYLRLAADFDNYKKRTRRDSEQRAGAEKESFIHDLLPVLDNLERALTCEPSPSSASLRQGVEMTLQMLARLLQSHGFEAVEDLGKPFDPHRQEAVSVRHDSRLPGQSVVEVVQRGYTHGEKVFRPARVIVNDSGHSSGADRAR